MKNIKNKLKKIYLFIKSKPLKVLQGLSIIVVWVVVADSFVEWTVYCENVLDFIQVSAPPTLLDNILTDTSYISSMPADNFYKINSEFSVKINSLVKNTNTDSLALDLEGFRKKVQLIADEAIKESRGNKQNIIQINDQVARIMKRAEEIRKISPFYNWKK